MDRLSFELGKLPQRVEINSDSFDPLATSGRSAPEQIQTRRHLLVRVLIVLLLLAFDRVALAQAVRTWNGPSGTFRWNTNLWSGGIPDTAGEAARISTAGVILVMDGGTPNYTINSLELLSSSELLISDGRTLNLSNLSSQIDSGAVVSLRRGAVLTGNSSLSALVNTGLISGDGTIDVGFRNSGGEISVDRSGFQLTISGGAKSNSFGTILASGGGLIQIDASQITNTNGFITADASSTVDYDTLVVGGNIRGAGTHRLIGDSEFRDIDHLSVNALDVNGQTLTVNSTNSISKNYRPNFVGTGTVQKVGNNTVRLLGNSLGFSGSYDAQAGALIGDANVFGNASSIVIGANGTVDIDHGGSAGVGAVLAGTGTFRKLGGGTITLTGDSSGFAGDFDIRSGTLVGDARPLANAGSININDNATLAVAHGGSAGISADLTGTGTFRKDSGGSVNLTGDNSAFAGTIHVAGGSLNVTGGATSANAILVDSAFRVSGGSIAASNRVFVGHNAGSSGLMEVDAATLDVVELRVGNTGSEGTFIATNSNVTIGNELAFISHGNELSNPGARTRGTATFNNSVVNHTGSRNLVVGYDGADSIGILNIENNTQFNHDFVAVGFLRGGTGTMNVNGGSDVFSQVLTVGTNTGSGTVTVDGAGTSLNIQGARQEIYVGDTTGGSGTLNVSNGAAVNSGGFINIGESGRLNVNGGIVSVSSVAVDGTATLVSGGVAVTNATTIGADGALNINGGTFSTGSLDNSLGGDVSLTGGMLSVDGTLTPGTSFTHTGGTLEVATIDGDYGFSGGLLDVVTVDGTLTQTGGILAPGDSPGTTTINGDYILNSGSLDMEIGGLLQGSQYDFLDINGDWFLNGGTLNVFAFNGYHPTVGATYDLFDFASLQGTGAFDAINLPTLSQGLEWDTSNLYSLGQLSVSAVPEPSAILGLAMLGYGMVVRRPSRRRR